MDNGTKPIVIAGIHRSGTTWVGRVISSENKSVHYVYEPMNPISPPGIPQPRFPHILYGDGGEWPDHTKAVSDILNGKFPMFDGSSIEVKNQLSLLKKSLGIRWAYLNKKRMVLKAPGALFFSDYLVNSHDAHVIILIRHPCAFVTSCLRLNWGLDLSTLTRQKKFNERYISDIQDFGTCEHKHVAEQIVINTWVWFVYHRYILDLKIRHEGGKNILFVRHEDLCYNPLKEYETLFNFVDLEFSESVQQKIKHETRGDTTYVSDGCQHHFVRDSKHLPKVWKEKLDPDTIAWIKETTADICDHFFDESSWS